MLFAGMVWAVFAGRYGDCGGFGVGYVFACGSCTMDPVTVADPPPVNAVGVPALHDGNWARATLEVCAALLESARTGGEVALQHQVSVTARQR